MPNPHGLAMKYGTQNPLQDRGLVVSSPVAGHIRKGMGSRKAITGGELCVFPASTHKLKNPLQVMAKVYQPKEYWEKELNKRFNIQGVGYWSLPKSFNLLLWRAMGRAVKKALRRASIQGDLNRCRVLDIGSGTGMWIDFWSRLGAKDITGVDITSVSTERLKTKYPQYHFYQLDISDPNIDVAGKFDIVSAMNVLTHVLDEKFSQSLQNIRGFLKPNGIAIVIDPANRNNWWGPPFTEFSNSKVRTLDHWQKILEENGLELRALLPVTSLLTNALDVPSPAMLHLLWFFWGVLSKFVGQSELKGKIIGVPLYVLDAALTALGIGLSTKCLLLGTKRKEFANGFKKRV